MRAKRVLFPFVSLLLITHLTSIQGILNQEQRSPYNCREDKDCSSKDTLLFCQSGQCQCLLDGTTYVHGIYLRFQMEWSVLKSKCVSKIHSPCTFKERWYPSDTTKLECTQDAACVPRSGTTSNRNYPYQNPHQSSRQYGGQDIAAVTIDDFGVCWSDNNNLGGGGSSGQSQFYPVLNPNQNNRHEFVTHGGNPYPVSPTKVNGQNASVKCINSRILMLANIILILYTY